MANLRKVAQDLAGTFSAYARSVFRASMFVKVVLLAGGALVAAIAEAVEIAHGNISTLTIVALAGFAIVFIGGVYVGVTESDASKALKIANEAISAT